MSLIHENVVFSLPNSPKSPSRYETIICATTIVTSALAIPRPLILFITVNVINAPITPPRSVILLSTLNSFMISGLPSITHIIAQVASAVNCTNIAVTHTLLAFVTFVLNAPCKLISAPDIIAIKNPAIN